MSSVQCHVPGILQSVLICQEEKLETKELAAILGREKRTSDCYLSRTMAAKIIAFSAFVASAAAFAPALAGVRTGATSLSMAMDKTARAPVITVFDHRGCTAHKNAEYTGRRTGDQDDAMCVKVQSSKIAVDSNVAADVLKSSLTVLPKA